MCHEVGIFETYNDANTENIEYYDFLDSDILTDIFLFSRYNNSKINKQLDKLIEQINSTLSYHPAWLSFHKINSINEVESSLERTRLNKEFNNRSVTETGDILHMFALKLMFTSNNIEDGEIQDTITQCKEYIEEINHRFISSNQIEKLYPAKNFNENAYNGYNYWIENSYSNEFGELLEYIEESRKFFFENNIKLLSYNILELLKTDIEQFIKNICGKETNDSPNLYYPILSHMSQRAFLEFLLSNPITNWYSISKALEIRFNTLKNISVFNEEKSWLKEFIDEVTSHIKFSTKINAVYIKKYILAVLYRLQNIEFKNTTET